MTRRVLTAREQAQMLRPWLEVTGVALPRELAEYVQQVLGAGYRVEPARLGPAGVVVHRDPPAQQQPVVARREG